MDWRAHDLLWLDVSAAFQAAGDLPGWLHAGWLRKAPLVVRRETVADGRIPVGVRGLQRNQRCKGYLAPAAVMRHATPETLAPGLVPGQRLVAAARTLPCIAALLALAPRLDALGLHWGPAGGAGFWLASDLPVLRPDSDLDLLVRAPRPLAPDQLAALRALQDGAACRLDIQVDTGHGGFALMDYSGGARRTLLKTAYGPLLVTDPWRLEEPT
jgi:phosphoribosyl-dephospho-CoA transferase